MEGPTNLLYQLAPVRKGSQGVLLYRITRDDNATPSPVSGPVTRKQLRKAFKQLSSGEKPEVRYIVCSERRFTGEESIKVTVDRQLQSLAQASAEENCHCFLALLEKRRKRKLEDNVEPRIRYVIRELQDLTGLDAITVLKRPVSEDSLPTERLYPRSRKVDAISVRTCGIYSHGTVLESWFDHVSGSAPVTYRDSLTIQILVVVTKQCLVKFICPQFVSEFKALQFLQQFSKGPQLELARAICQQIEFPLWDETWKGPLLVTAVRLGERDLAHRIGQQIDERLEFTTLTALGQQYEIFGDSTDKLRLDELHWQCIRPEGRGFLSTSYEALKAFFAGLTGLIKNHFSIMFHNCLYQLLTDETILASGLWVQEVIQDLIGVRRIIHQQNGRVLPEFKYPPMTQLAWHLILFGVNKCLERLDRHEISKLHESITLLYKEMEEGLNEGQRSFVEQFLHIDKGAQVSRNDHKRKRQDDIN